MLQESQYAKSFYFDEREARHGGIEIVSFSVGIIFTKYNLNSPHKTSLTAPKTSIHGSRPQFTVMDGTPQTMLLPKRRLDACPPGGQHVDTSRLSRIEPNQQSARHSLGTCTPLEQTGRTCDIMGHAIFFF